LQVLGVLASGRGSNLQAIIDHIRLGVLQGVEVGVLVCNRWDADVLNVAAKAGVQYEVVDHRNKEREAFDRQVADVLMKNGVDHVILAGYMRLLSLFFFDQFPHKILNIHPSLLPSFPGLHAQRQAYDYGVKVSGCTTIYVDKGVDTGPIILQHPIHVKESDTEDTLSDKILVFEHRLYSKAIQLVIDGRVQIQGRRTQIDYSNRWEELWNERQKIYVQYQDELWRKSGKPLDKFLS